MAIDLAVDLMHATVQLEQPLAGGQRTVGTGFLISDPTPDGRPRIVLITANHVLAGMPGQMASVGFRIENADGSWTYTPQEVRIRDAGGHELWTHHPSRDVAAMSVTVPPEFAKAAIPKDYLASDDTFVDNKVRAGDEMMALGFPRGLAANQAGFPILRSGRIASYPVAPAKIFPTFLLDFSVFPGNSGGPVFMTDQDHRPVAGGKEPEFIAGLLTQQVELNHERLEIGIVTHAKFIRETLSRIDNPAAPVTQVAEIPVTGAKAASAEEAARPD